MSMTSVEHHPSMLVRDDPSMALEADQDLSRTQMPNTPLLSQVHPPNVRERRLNGDIAIFPGDSASSRSTGANPRRRACAPRVRKQKTMIRKSKRSQSRITPMPLDPAEEHKNCVGREEPPHLKDTCPPEERCIFESRWRNRHKKGQDMWDSIQADFHEQFSKTHGKEMLQMKFKRARSKYYVWLPEDVSQTLQRVYGFLSATANLSAPNRKIFSDKHSWNWKRAATSCCWTSSMSWGARAICSSTLAMSRSRSSTT